MIDNYAVLKTFDGLDNRRNIMDMLARLGSDLARARFLESLIGLSLKGFAGSPMKVTGACDTVSAYLILTSICAELGVRIDVAAQRLEQEVRRL